MVDIVTVGVLRELGVLLTAIIVAGRSGSAFAAEIGAMKLNEESTRCMPSASSRTSLILPRVIGLVIAMPLLAVIADGIGLTRGALLCKWLLDMPLVLYLERAQDAIAPTTFWVGIIKAPVFGLLIALSGTYRGLQVRDSSRDSAASPPPRWCSRSSWSFLPCDVRHRLLAAGHLMAEALIEVRGLVNRFGAQVVHDHLDMTVERGEVFGIVGGSGSGKSVLLRSILGLQRRRPRQAGSMLGRDLTQLSTPALKRSRRLTASLSSRARCFRR